MRMLIAGATGFLGSNLVHRLLLDGHELVGVDNGITGRTANLAGLEQQPRFTLLECDVIQPAGLNGLTGPLDWVLQFASPASPPKYLAHPVATLRVNAEGTYQLLELARRIGARFFLASTSEVYGDPVVHPQPESYWGNVNPIGPRSVYDEGKRYAEALTMALSAGPRGYADHPHLQHLRPAHGSRTMAAWSATSSCRRCAGEPLTVYGAGGQTRSFQYVDDLVEGIVRLLGVDYHGPVNLGNPEEYTMLELANLVKELTGSASPILFEPLPEDDPRQRCPDITLARELLDWEPHVSIREGLALTIAYFRSQL